MTRLIERSPSLFMLLRRFIRMDLTDQQIDTIVKSVQEDTTYKTVCSCAGGCGRGVRVRDAVNGMCPQCAEAAIKDLQDFLQEDSKNARFVSCQ
jgi:hypothetical protein